jgi:hypothetical protein
MMEAVRTSETSVDNHFTWQYIPEDNSEHKDYYFEVPLNAITCLPNFMKTYQSVHKLLVGNTQTDRQADRQADRQTDW